MTDFTDRELGATEITKTSVSSQVITKIAKPPAQTFTKAVRSTQSVSKVPKVSSQELVKCSLASQVIEKRADLEPTDFTPLEWKPTIVVEPVATPSIYGCVITWTVDAKSYHRVRYKLPGGEWTTTDWSTDKTTVASVTLTSLDDQNTEYIYDIQSCYSGRGDKAFDWHKGDDSLNFYTLCHTPFVFSNVLPSVWTDVFARTSLLGNWDTDNNKTESRVAFKKDGGAWQYSTWQTESPPTTSFSRSIISGLTNPTDVGYYNWYVQNRDICGNEEDSSQHKFKIVYNSTLSQYEIQLAVEPVVTPAFDSCLITWETDFEGYHRVRYKTVGGEWTTTDWTESKSTAASITLSSLDPQHTEYIYAIQSGYNGDGTKAFDWTPGDDTSSFYTLCNTPFVFSDFEVVLFQIGRAYHARFAWKADNAAGYEKTEKLIKYHMIGQNWVYLWWTATSGTSFAMDTTYSVGKGDYEWYSRNKDVCGNNEISEMQTFSILENPFTKELYIETK